MKKKQKEHMSLPSCSLFSHVVPAHIHLAHGAHLHPSCMFVLIGAWWLLATRVTVGTLREVHPSIHSWHAIDQARRRHVHTGSNRA